MKHYLLRGGRAAALLLSLLLLAATTWAQAPMWTLNTTTADWYPTGNGYATAMATDDSGNLFVTGYFFSTIRFGSITLASAGSTDIFLAKYVPATASWAWAVRGGGTGFDEGRGVAVRDNTIYLTGLLENNAANAYACTFAGSATGTGTAPQAGAVGGIANGDLVLAKYTDNGTSASFGWSQVAGGSSNDSGFGVAVSGNNVYVTGALYNTNANLNGVLLGGSGLTAGTLPQYGSSNYSGVPDMVLLKYVDNGPSATVAWSQVGGGDGADVGSGLAVSGNSVYVVGTLKNSKTNDNAVLFGGAGTMAGTLPQYGASLYSTGDILLAKYIDNGVSATVAWTQVAGGNNQDAGKAVAVRGASVYVTGLLVNNLANYENAVFGGTGITPGTLVQHGAGALSSSDIVLAKYTDLGTSATVAWTQVGGGIGNDGGTSVVASGSTIYVAGTYQNNLTNGNSVLFGGSGTTAGTVAVPGISTNFLNDIVLAKYVDNGSSASVGWTKTAGGASDDDSRALVLADNRLYVLGKVAPPAAFDSFTTGPASSFEINFLASLNLSGALAATPTAASASASLYPNPTSGPATLSGATPNATVHILDALGRRVATATTDATGAAPLPAGLAPGLYLVRAGAGTVRWIVE